MGRILKGPKGSGRLSLKGFLPGSFHASGLGFGAPQSVFSFRELFVEHGVAFKFLCGFMGLSWVPLGALCGRKVLRMRGTSRIFTCLESEAFLVIMGVIALIIARIDVTVTRGNPLIGTSAPCHYR